LLRIIELVWILELLLILFKRLILRLIQHNWSLNRLYLHKILISIGILKDLALLTTTHSSTKAIGMNLWLLIDRLLIKRNIHLDWLELGHKVWWNWDYWYFQKIDVVSMSSNEGSKSKSIKTVVKLFTAVPSKWCGFPSICNKWDSVYPFSCSARNFQQMIIRTDFKDFSLCLLFFFYNVVCSFDVFTIWKFVVDCKTDYEFFIVVNFDCINFNCLSVFSELSEVIKNFWLFVLLAYFNLMWNLFLYKLSLIHIIDLRIIRR